jgi:hypothetical protein
MTTQPRMNNAINAIIAVKHAGVQILSALHASQLIIALSARLAISVNAIQTIMMQGAQSVYPATLHASPATVH